MINDDSTVQEARAFLKTQDDTDCPCCTQKVKTYRRNLPAADLPALVSLYEQTKAEIRRQKKAGQRQLGPIWIHIRDLQGKSGGGDFAKFAAWGFIMARPNTDDPTKRDSGFWALRRPGAQFLRNEIVVTKRMFFRLGKCYGPVDPNETVDFAEANAECHFNFRTLMGATS